MRLRSVINRYGADAFIFVGFLPSSSSVWLSCYSVIYAA